MARRMSRQPAKHKLESLKVEVRFPYPADVIADYANFAAAQFTGNEFVVNFLQVVPPTEQSPDAFAQFTAERTVDAQIAVQVIMPPAMFAEFIDNCVPLIEQLRSQKVLPPPREQPARLARPAPQGPGKPV